MTMVLAAHSHGLNHEGGVTLLRTRGLLPGMGADMCSLRWGIGADGACALNPALPLQKALPQKPYKLPRTPRPATARHGHGVQETHYLDKPFYFLYWVYTNLQDTNAELTGGLFSIYI